MVIIVRQDCRVMPYRNVLQLYASAVLGLLLLSQTRGRAQSFSDDFASPRTTLTEASGSLAGDNRGATAEQDEPRHGENAGRHSVWVSWIAPDNGLATFAIPSSTFDTLIAVYWREPGDGTDLERLRRVARDDDSGPEGSTLIQFATEAGRRYEIAIDGYGWQTGEFVLTWELLFSATPLPVILGTPSNIALRLGDTMTLVMDLQMTDDLHIHWYRNGDELDDEEQPTLVVTDLKETDLGQYRVRLSVDDFRIWSEPIEVQINSEGLVAVLARDKVLDALSNGLEQSSADPNLGVTSSGTDPRRALRPMGPTPGVVRGYQGTQIFNTSVGARDPLEPAHCGADLGPTYWFAYQPPEAGLVTLDTAGSSFDTILTLYTFDPPLRSYDDLRLVGCDDNSGGDNRSSMVRFAADPARTYCLVVSGAGGDSGIAHLSYLLDTNAVAGNLPPVLGEPPVSQTVAPGSDVMFHAVALGAAPLKIRWLKDNAPIPSATNASLRLPGVQAADGGAYHATISNPFGATMTTPARLEIVDPPSLRPNRTGAHLTILVSATRGVRYTLERSEDPQTGVWTPLDMSTGANLPVLEFTNAPITSPRGFYRVSAE